MKRYSFFQKRIVLIFVVYCLLFAVRSQSEENLTRKAQIDSYQKQLAVDATRVDIRLKLAKVYLQIEAYTQAVAEYREVISFREAMPNHNSDLPEGYYGLGLAYAGLEKFDEAIEAYKQAIQYAPEWAHIHAALGAGYASLHRYDAALNAYKTAHDLKPDDAMIHHQLGNIYSKQGKRSEAITHQQRAITIDPTLASAHYQLGLLYTQENRLAKAISAYETAYAADPELIETLYNLAQVHRRNGNKQAAREKMQLFEKQKKIVKPIQELRGALQRTRESTQRAKILANIGRLYLKNKHYKKAVKEYEKAIALNPKGTEAYNGVGIAYTMLKRYSEAIAAQQEALALQPDFAEAHAGLGLAYLMQNGVDHLALKHYRQAITLNPQFLEAHLKIGIILLNQKRYVAAASAYQKAIALNPDNAEAYHNLGVCYAHQDKTKDALSALEKVVDIARSSQVSNTTQGIKTSFLPETYYMIGELQAQQKNFDAAESAYLLSGLPKAYNALAQLSAKIAGTYEKQSKRSEKLKKAASYAQTAIRLNPNIASYHNTLALIAYRNGDYQTAETSIRKAIELDPKNRNYQEGLKQILKR
ncbi:MAG: tetratricopeptide repeat protein [Candidatus Poribacteria bacterium]|nr:tetratricopeptide repeat protein [Candidatus Poribacteria bacterium]